MTPQDEKKALDALEFAQGAILDAIGLEDGLDGAAGAAVIRMIREALEANGRALTPLPDDTTDAMYESTTERLYQSVAEVAQLRQERDAIIDALGLAAGGIGLGLVGEIKRLVTLEAARDHLRARLRLLLKNWQAAHAEMEHRRDERVESCTMYETLSQHYSSYLTAMYQCAADLLAVLTEPTQHENNEKTNTNATRSAETDVTREVALPQRED